MPTVRSDELEDLLDESEEFSLITFKRILRKEKKEISKKKVLRPYQVEE
jgi:hypothetical protein